MWFFDPDWLKGTAIRLYQIKLGSLGMERIKDSFVLLLISVPVSFQPACSSDSFFRPVST
jgi:hypothetical protein